MAWALPLVVFIFGASVMIAFASISSTWVIAPAVPLVPLALMGQLFGMPLSRHERTGSDAVWRALAQAVLCTESLCGNRFVSLRAEQRT